MWNVLLSIGEIEELERDRLAKNRLVICKQNNSNTLRANNWKVDDTNEMNDECDRSAFCDALSFDSAIITLVGWTRFLVPHFIIENG